MKDLVNLRASNYLQGSIPASIQAVAKKASEVLGALLLDKEPIVKRYIVSKSLYKIDLKKKLDSVIKSEAELAKISEDFIDQKIPILENSKEILDSLHDLEKEIECPACGRLIAGNDFKKHVQEELEELKKAREARSNAISDKQTFTAALSSFVNQYNDEKAFLDWLALPENQEINSIFTRFSQTHIEQTTKRWTLDLIETLKETIEEITHILEEETKIEPPATTTAVSDLEFFRACLKLPRLEQIGDSINKIRP